MNIDPRLIVGGLDTVSEFIREIGSEFQWLNDYASTPQDLVWHAEGDVHVHTDMVLEETRKLLEGESKHLNEPQKAVLMLAALLHDVAKPISTKEMSFDGSLRTVAPQHEMLGGGYLFHKVPPLGLDYDQWRQVIALTAYHHLPKRLVVKDLGMPAYCQLARRVDLELVYWLEVADMRGRTCQDKEEQLEILELFRLQCEEYGLWCNPPYGEFQNQIRERYGDMGPWMNQRIFYSGIRAYEQGTIYMLEEEFARCHGYKDNQSHLAILCGVSGSGKSCYVKEHLSTYDLISLDEIRLEITGDIENQKSNGKARQIAKERLLEALRRKRNVVWDATNIRRDFRSLIANLGFQYGAFVSLIVIQKDEARLRKDNRNRLHPVTDDVLERQLSRFQLPDIQEAHIVSWMRLP